MGIITGKDIIVQAGKKEIIKGVDFSLPQGKVTAIIGPNGSGKSTLLKAICGVLSYTGEIYWQDKLLKTIKRSELAKRLAFLPQNLEIPADVTVTDLVEHGRFPHRSWWQPLNDEDKKWIEGALQQTGMEKLKERLVSTLSGGERQRAWIAMALAQNPEILFLDEPTTYLDICHQLEVLQLLRVLNKEKDLTVVMVIHDLNQVLQFADYVIVVEEGRIIHTGEPAEIITEQLLQDVFRVKSERVGSFILPVHTL